MAAIATKQPLCNIDAKEAKMLAEAIIECGKQYGTTINPKLLALMQLGGAAAAVYGPRIWMLHAMKQNAPKRTPPPPQGGNVSDIRQKQPGGPAINTTEAPLGEIKQPPIQFG